MFKMSTWCLRAACLLMLLALFATGSSCSHAQISPPLITNLSPSVSGAIFAQTPPGVATPIRPEVIS